MFDFNRILVPVDFSECSEKALGVAMGLAMRTNAQMFLLYVDEKPGNGTWVDDAKAQLQLDTLENDEACLRALADRVGGEVAESIGLPSVGDQRMRVRIGSGDAAAQILGAAADSEADLIVMGTHGRTSLRDLFVGSTTEQVTRKASCAVLAVKPEGYPFLRD
ncbi:MAG: universal stress protein [Proteobacteria bacterium]|nr:universal stress protein [Pseudomonadota bacterium]